MTETYILTEKIVGETYFSKQPIRYVTYTTPSPEDKDWSLVWYAHQYPTQSRPTHYFRCYKFIDDDQARQDYPIFRELAMARNWAPMDEIPDSDLDEEPSPCKHQGKTESYGATEIDGTWYNVHHCDQCHKLFLGGMTMPNKKPASREAIRRTVLLLNKAPRQTRYEV